MFGSSLSLNGIALLDWRDDDIEEQRIMLVVEAISEQGSKCVYERRDLLVKIRSLIEAKVGASNLQAALTIAALQWAKEFPPIVESVIEAALNSDYLLVKAVLADRAWMLGDEKAIKVLTVLSGDSYSDVKDIAYYALSLLMEE